MHSSQGHPREQGNAHGADDLLMGARWSVSNGWCAACSTKLTCCTLAWLADNETSNPGHFLDGHSSAASDDQ